MLEVVPSETLAALAGVTLRGSDASAIAAVLAMERLRRLEWGISTYENQPYYFGPSYCVSNRFCNDLKLLTNLSAASLCVV